eukprot:TRINITY_DN7173_c0_g1_i2.p1 TRINITY_DN7173_c0_g1~~TRINITY_DN7173_c0_g1_i2.p1  ORF type:complete len:437 (+),score=49.04 TRINITY_DN7173_c0_g1_i2:104-1414(+)
MRHVMSTRLPLRIQMRAMSSASRIVIAGGSVMGCSTAWHLKTLNPNCHVTVIERDPYYSKASATRSAGGIRQQFSLPENITMSLYGLDFLRGLPELCARHLGGDTSDHSIGFRENGYTFLAGSTAGAAVLQANIERQHAHGATWIEALSPERLATVFPWLRTDDIVLGSRSTQGEGIFDPSRLIDSLRALCKVAGVTFVHGSLQGLETGSTSNAPNPQEVTRAIVSTTAEDLLVEECDVFVNAAGAHAAPILAPLSIDIPVRARKRHVFSFACGAKTPPGNTSPLLVDPNGAYFRPEVANAMFICGISPDADNDPDCLDDATLDEIDHNLFEDLLWPTLYHRVPSAFDNIKVKGAWAGHYDYNTLDQNALLGLCPGTTNVYLCNGFSGHGLQQSPAAGRAIAEMILHGECTSMDLDRFKPDRILDHSLLVFEDNIV